MIKVSSLIAGTIQQYNVSETDTRVGLVQYGDNIEILHRLQDKTAINEKLKLLSSSKGDRDITKALREISTKAFVRPPRPGAKQKIFVFVAGPTDELNNLEAVIVGNELKKMNIEVQFVYIGDHSSKSLLPFVDSNNDIMHIASSNEIAFALDPLLRMRGVTQGNSIRLNSSIHVIVLCV